MFSDLFEKKNKKQLLINCEKMEKRVALLNNSRLEEYQIERDEERNIAGSVYLGRIVNYESSLQAAFVDIGTEKNAFLHYWDMLPATYENSEKILFDRKEAHDKKRTRLNKESDDFNKYMTNLASKRKRININDLPRIFPVGSEIPVQVSKGPIGTKGPRVTANITLPGRYLVLLPFEEDFGISKKIEDRAERERLRKIMLELDIPEGMGCICRTFGEDRKSVFFKRDIDMLLELWNRGISENGRKKAPFVIFEEPSLIERTARDFLTEDIDEIIVDDENAYLHIKDILGGLVSPKMASKVHRYSKARPLFEEYGVEKHIAAIYERRIPLESGGFICIDETEALVAIDVNSGTNKGKNQADTIVKTNLEACDEIARQTRLRNIGGIIVIDFIDMRPAGDREAVFKKMKNIIKSDRARTKVYPISRLGLMEMTRQRDTESIREAMFDICPYCEGRGKVKSAVSMSVEIQRALNEIIRRYHKDKNFSVRVIMHPTVLARMKNSDSIFLTEMEKKYSTHISFRGDISVHLEEFKLIDPVTAEEYR